MAPGLHDEAITAPHPPGPYMSLRGELDVKVLEKAFAPVCEESKDQWHIDSSVSLQRSRADGSVRYEPHPSDAQSHCKNLFSGDHSSVCGRTSSRSSGTLTASNMRTTLEFARPGAQRDGLSHSPQTVKTLYFHDSPPAGPRQNTPPPLFFAED